MKHKVVQYNCTKYGDPISMYYGDPFLPIFALYRDSTLSEIVPNDIAIWEDYGQSTFTFNTTAEKAGCQSQPQSLRQFVTANTTDIDTAWTPDKYDKCYDSDSTFSTGTTPWNTGVVYTLTNTSNQNALVWTGETNRVYFFTARVMDGNYSYCMLTTHFAVSVYGAPMSAGIQASVVFGFMAFVVGCLAGSYYIHKGKVLSERADKEKEE